MNSVHIIGRMTKDPVLLKTKAGKDILRFIIKTERRLPESAEILENSPRQLNFIPCFATGEKASAIAANMEKGHRIGISGHLQSYMRLDKTNAGHYEVEVFVDRYDFLTPRKPKFMVVP